MKPPGLHIHRSANTCFIWQNHSQYGQLTFEVASIIGWNFHLILIVKLLSQMMSIKSNRLNAIAHRAYGSRQNEYRTNGIRIELQEDIHHPSYRAHRQYYDDKQAYRMSNITFMFNIRLLYHLKLLFKLLDCVQIS